MFLNQSNHYLVIIQLTIKIYDHHKNVHTNYTNIFILFTLNKSQITLLIFYLFKMK